MIASMRPLNLTSQALESVVELTYCYEAWWSLVNRDNKASFGAPSERYDAFFSTASRSLLLSATVIAHQLFEKRKQGDTVSIETLLRSFPGANSQLEMQIRSEIKSNWPIVQKVFALRNEVYAHRSSASSPEDVFRKVAITPNQLKEVVGLAQRCVAQLAEAVGDRYEHEFLEELESISSLVKEDLADLMLALNEQMQR